MKLKRLRRVDFKNSSRFSKRFPYMNDSDTHMGSVKAAAISKELEELVKGVQAAREIADVAGDGTGLNPIQILLLNVYLRNYKYKRPKQTFNSSMSDEMADNALANFKDMSAHSQTV